MFGALQQAVMNSRLAFTDLFELVEQHCQGKLKIDSSSPYAQKKYPSHDSGN